MENNQITLIGSIYQEINLSHEILNEKFYEFVLEVSRLSDISDFLPITISERVFDLEQLTIGKKVKLTGQLRSYSNHYSENNKLKLTTFVKNIELVDDNIKDYNNIVLNGFICKQPIHRITTTKKEITDVIVAVNRTYKKSDYIPVILWNQNAHQGSKLIIGDNIKITGRLQSRNYIKRVDEEYAIQKIAYEVSTSKLEVYGNNKPKIIDEI